MIRINRTRSLALPQVPLVPQPLRPCHRPLILLSIPLPDTL